ncbi:MAG: hypothetical protein ACJ8EC_06570 [Microvirga sp.]
MPKKPDDIVGQSQGPIVGGGHQTPEQKAITERSGGGLTDAERNAQSTESGDEPGRAPTAVGGSSQGQADRMPAGGASVSNETASNPAVTPGHKHKTS